MDVDLEACIAGDPDAWNALLERVGPLVYSMVGRTIGRREGRGTVEIDDCVQDVFLRLVRHDYRLLRSYDPARASLSTWISLIARSVAIDHLRKRRLHATSFDEDASWNPAVEPVPRESGSLDDGVVPIHLLTARQQTIIRMLFEQGLSVARAAALVGVDEQTIRSTKHKALTRLREQMARGDDGDANDV